MKKFSRIGALIMTTALCLSMSSVASASELPNNDVEQQFQKQAELNGAVIEVAVKHTDGTVSNYTFDGRPMTSTTYDKDGNAVPMPLYDYGYARIPAAGTKKYYNEDGDRFKLEKGDELDIVVVLDNAAKISIGYDYLGNTRYKYEASEKKYSHRVSITINTNGNYCFVVRNDSKTDSIMVNYARIESV